MKVSGSKKRLKNKIREITWGWNEQDFDKFTAEPIPEERVKDNLLMRLRQRHTQIFTDCYGIIKIETLKELAGV